MRAVGSSEVIDMCSVQGLRVQQCVEQHVGCRVPVISIVQRGCLLKDAGAMPESSRCTLPAWSSVQ